MANADLHAHSEWKLFLLLETVLEVFNKHELHLVHSDLLRKYSDVNKIIQIIYN